MTDNRILQFVIVYSVGNMQSMRNNNISPGFCQKRLAISNRNYTHLIRIYVCVYVPSEIVVPVYISLFHHCEW